MTAADLTRLRPVSVSMGLMLESASERLSLRGGPHFGSPDKLPQRRLATLAAAGALAVPFTTGLLIGIGETRRERLESLLALRALHARHGHLQEIIIQNFRAKAGTRMAQASEPSLEEQLWTLAVTRVIFGAAMSLQAPPNLQPGELTALVHAGANDWGGVSPVTPDHVNPEAPWPRLQALEEETRAAGRHLTERLALTPAFVRQARPGLTGVARRGRAARGRPGRARTDGWYAGAGTAVPPSLARELGAARRRGGGISRAVAAVLRRAQRGADLSAGEITTLFGAHGADLHAVLRAADRLRRMTVGEEISYVVNRNINYTNICLYHCGFCAFSKGTSARSLRGVAYRLDLEEIARRTREARAAGATEVCLRAASTPSTAATPTLRSWRP
jgi:FO synthase